MSTRSTTHFNEGSRTIAIVYRHSDGYPEGAGTDILRFLDECSKLNDPRFTDPSYLAAKYVVFLADEFRGNSPLDFLSVGILLEDPGDIEYLYLVNCDNLQDGRPTVTCYPVSFNYKTNKQKRGEPVEIPKPSPTVA